MPKLPFVSGKEILARLIRGTGYKLPSTYHDDILEWIGEGMNALQVTNTLELKCSGEENCPDEIYVRNYCASLPCGFVSVESLSDENGFAILEESSLNSNTTSSNTLARPSVFMVNPFVHQTSDGTTGTPSIDPNIYINIQGGDLTPAIQSVQSYYKIKGNKIQTSFECGFVTLKYWSIPVCPDGYPMIPDNENYKQALVWHVLRNLIGAGYQHQVFSWDKCNEQYEILAPRAMNEISFYSPDGARRLHNTMVRLMPPTGYSEAYFI